MCRSNNAMFFWNTESKKVENKIFHNRTLDVKCDHKNIESIYHQFTWSSTVGTGRWFETTEMIVKQGNHFPVTGTVLPCNTEIVVPLYQGVVTMLHGNVLTLNMKMLPHYMEKCSCFMTWILSRTNHSTEIERWYRENVSVTRKYDLVYTVNLFVNMEMLQYRVHTNQDTNTQMLLLTGKHNTCVTGKL